MNFYPITKELIRLGKLSGVAILFIHKLRFQKNRSKWLADELFLGSYTFITPEASELATDPFALLASPIYHNSKSDDIDDGEQIPHLRVLFGGEGTHSEMFQTTTGAFLSGQREADRVADYLRASGNRRRRRGKDVGRKEN